MAPYIGFLKSLPAGWQMGADSQARVAGGGGVEGSSSVCQHEAVCMSCACCRWVLRCTHMLNNDSCVEFDYNRTSINPHATVFKVCAARELLLLHMFHSWTYQGSKILELSNILQPLIHMAGGPFHLLLDVARLFWKSSSRYKQFMGFFLLPRLAGLTNHRTFHNSVWCCWLCM